ncbi:MAG: hypothetical protein DU429_08735 [Candidatus Tokpelaia sp.]|nr:MAG: hypothetical protein DU430_09080 [Candidatus Tokpelaia sp.]KAA6205061.1 MAG: hypothetical protein DU429_08735 [Candidatus Tokpelaia sp.]
MAHEAQMTEAQKAECRFWASKHTDDSETGFGFTICEAAMYRELVMETEALDTAAGFCPICPRS